MKISLPDPNYTGSERAKLNFRLALKLSFCFVALLWLIFGLDWLLGLQLKRFGIFPRHIDGLIGLPFAPLLHGSFAHLFSNSVPLLVLGTGILYLYPAGAFRVIPAVYLGSGLGVWLFGRASIHIGASGLVYGLATYIFVAGILRRDMRAIAASMLVYFLYGTLAWGVLPIKAGVSWETHLAAAIIGLLAAIAFRNLDAPPSKRYAWEDEEENES
ncbi:MAG: rhomboid family intramembrane serine protease [Candidatus Competibacteraceae bacterium]|jgi:membrane associated rhomboid family serine protease|nr:rhomboid family intramembrane serine protease [Candidatus Competibacteraceae bacterium]